MDIEELSNKIDKYHEDDEKRAKKDKYENISYVASGLALATLSIFIAEKDWIVAVVTIILLVCGIISLRKALKIKIE
jgi:hypothetical protein